jgi:pretoxin HINT domain-containing protein
VAEVTDPRAVPMVWQVFTGGGEASQLIAVRLLDQIEGPGASNALATLAIFCPSAKVRRRAADTLVHRDPRDVVGRLINLVRRPFKYTVQPGAGPGSPVELYVDGERFDVRRLYRFSTFDVRLVPVPTPPLPASAIGDVAEAMRANDGMFVTLPGVRPVIVAGMASAVAEQRQRMIEAAMRETLERNRTVQQSLQEDIRSVEAANAQINQVDDRVLPILKALTGHDLGTDPDSWRKWWTDQLGYVYQSSQPSTKPTYTDTVAMPDVSIAAPGPTFFTTHSACFAAGTLVHTLDGPRPIESIQVGDRVLSQDPSAGVLTFEPVVAVHHNEPAPTLRIGVDGETIIATGIHRFWKAGKGWTMARELKAGDRVRVIDGVMQVRSIETDSTQPVYNLDVARNRDFFVGTKGLLVHDFSFVQPVQAPFDRHGNLVAPAP